MISFEIMQRFCMSKMKLPRGASRLKKSSVYRLFSTIEIIPTRQVETRSKLFCIDRLIPFGFI